MKKLFWILLTFAPSLAFAGQHSGLGGGTTPTPPPQPENPLPEAKTLEQWLLEQFYGPTPQSEQSTVSK